MTKASKATVAAIAAVTSAGMIYYTACAASLIAGLITGASVTPALLAFVLPVPVAVYGYRHMSVYCTPDDRGDNDGERKDA